MKGRDRMERDEGPGAGGVGLLDQAGEDLERNRLATATLARGVLVRRQLQFGSQLG